MEGSQRECGLGGLIHREQSHASAGGTASTGGTTSTDSTDEHGQHGQHGLARSYTELHGVTRSTRTCTDYTDYTDSTDFYTDDYTWLKYTHRCSPRDSFEREKSVRLVTLI